MTGSLKSEWSDMATKRYFPKCFSDDKQFTGWVTYARQAPPAPAHSFCEDCTPEYQGKMIQAKRCMYPGTLFHKSGSDLKGTTSEGDWVGRRSALEVAKVRTLAWHKKDVKLV
jgi:hypothetical protein